MDGIEIINKEKYSIYYIGYLSDDFKKAIRDHLALMCHGKDEVDSGHIYASYKSTIKEFLIRFNGKTDEQKKGQVGELLTHLIIRTQLPAYEICSPFFNMEERSAKKGFDIIIFKDMELWINEVKSGEPTSSEQPTTKLANLLNSAETDLADRINVKEKGLSLWLEAINGAKKIVSEKCNKKDSIIEILRTVSDDSSTDGLSSQDSNVILSAVLFNRMENRFEEDVVERVYEEIVDRNAFKSLYIIAIQEQAYQDVALFLQDEAKINE